MTDAPPASRGVREDYGPAWTTSEPVRIGGYDVSFREAIPGGVRFWLADAGFIDPVGLAYAPQGVPQESSYGHYWHIQGDWYGFRVDSQASARSPECLQESAHPTTPPAACSGPRQWLSTH